MPAQHLKGIITMSHTADRLYKAAFPDEYADVLIQVLAITWDNFLSIKDALYNFRSLDEHEASSVLLAVADAIARHNTEEA